MANNPYAIVVVALSDEDGGGFVGFVPDLKGCMSDGATSEEALKNTEQAILEWLDAAREFGQEIPEPNSAHEDSIRSQEELLLKIEGQTKAIEQCEEEIKHLRSMLSALTRRLNDSRPSWLLDPMPAVLAQRTKEPAMH